MATFKDIIGQEQIKAHFKTMVESGQVSHAYIIHGEQSSGKDFIARIFATALQCESKETAPCGECRSCKQAANGNQPDIIFVQHEKPNTIGVEDIRTQIVNDMGIKPYSSPYKIYIVNEAEKMTPQAQNALLKTLEEPPAYGMIILLTTNVDSFLPTILSRCIVLNMKPVPDALVTKFLMEELNVPDYKAEVCTAFARGNIGKAKALATSEEFEQIKSDAVSLLKYVKEMDLADLVTTIKKITEYKFQIKDYLDIIMVWYRDVLLLKATNDANHLIFKEEIQYIRKVAVNSSYEGLETIIRAIETAKSRLDANVNFDLTMELMFLVIKEN
ncbi:MAG: DNA polymerase III subunit delta [Lachnospiraceae bacterium]|nr:DNA polymerase III subunit delta [Lachnospiraceae bacterium]